MRTAREQRLFNTYRYFNQVSYNPNNPIYQRLAEQGIQLENHFHSFRHFRDWVEQTLGPQPGPDYMIIRKRHDRGFKPSNLKWGQQPEITLEQHKDRRITYRGRTLNICQWAKVLDMSPHVLYTRVSKGITRPKELFAPSRRIRK